MTSLQKMLLSVSLFSLTAFSVQAGAVGAFVSYVETEDAAEGSGYGAKLELGFSEEVSLEGRISRLEDFEPDVGLPADQPPAGLEVTPIEVGLSFKIPLQEMLIPYIGGGVGIYLLEVDSDGLNADIDDEFGWYGFGGLKINISQTLTLFAEVQYRSIEGTFESSSLIDDLNRDRVDVELSSLGANAGIMINW